MVLVSCAARGAFLGVDWGTYLKREPEHLRFRQPQHETSNCLFVSAEIPLSISGKQMHRCQSQCHRILWHCVWLPPSIDFTLPLLSLTHPPLPSSYYVFAMAVMTIAATVAANPNSVPPV